MSSDPTPEPDLSTEERALAIHEGLRAAMKGKAALGIFAILGVLDRELPGLVEAALDHAEASARAKALEEAAKLLEDAITEHFDAKRMCGSCKGPHYSRSTMSRDDVKQLAEKIRARAKEAPRGS